VREAIEANVDGIIFVHSIGQSADGDFLKSIRAIANGSSYYPKEVRTMAGYVKSVALAGLSDCESEVLEALCQGMSNKEIAEVLFVSPETIKSHVSTVIGKLGVKDRTQAVIFCHTCRNVINPLYLKLFRDLIHRLLADCNELMGLVVV